MASYISVNVVQSNPHIDDRHTDVRLEVIAELGRFFVTRYRGEVTAKGNTVTLGGLPRGVRFDKTPPLLYRSKWSINRWKPIQQHVQNINKQPSILKKEKNRWRRRLTWKCSFTWATRCLATWRSCRWNANDALASDESINANIYGNTINQRKSSQTSTFEKSRFRHLNNFESVLSLGPRDRCWPFGCLAA